jgi:hypothetical protein
MILPAMAVGFAGLYVWLTVWKAESRVRVDSKMLDMPELWRLHRALTNSDASRI